MEAHQVKSRSLDRQTLQRKDPLDAKEEKQQVLPEHSSAPNLPLPVNGGFLKSKSYLSLSQLHISFLDKWIFFWLYQCMLLLRNCACSFCFCFYLLTAGLLAFSTERVVYSWEVLFGTVWEKGMRIWYQLWKQKVEAMLNWIYSVKFSVWKPWKVSEAEYERTAVVGIAGLRTEGDLNVLCIVCLYWSII